MLPIYPIYPIYPKLLYILKIHNTIHFPLFVHFRLLIDMDLILFIWNDFFIITTIFLNYGNYGNSGNSGNSGKYASVLLPHFSHFILSTRIISVYICTVFILFKVGKATIHSIFLSNRVDIFFQLTPLATLFTKS